MPFTYCRLLRHNHSYCCPRAVTTSTCVGTKTVTKMRLISLLMLLSAFWQTTLASIEISVEQHVIQSACCDGLCGHPKPTKDPRVIELEELMAKQEEVTERLEFVEEVLRSVQDFTVSGNSFLQRVTSRRRRVRRQALLTTLDDCNDPDQPLSGNTEVLGSYIFENMDDLLEDPDMLDLDLVFCYSNQLAEMTSDINSGTLLVGNLSAAFIAQMRSTMDEAEDVQADLEEEQSQLEAALEALEEAINDLQEELGIEPSWSYDGDDGPDAWADLFETCGGDAQSPINIVTGSVSNSPAVDALVFTNYDSAPDHMEILNTGYSASVLVDSASPPTISGGGLDGDYILAGYNFHWGPDDSSPGSEHTVDGTSYEAELRLVHYKEPYGLSDAFNHDDGLAILAIFVEVGAANSNLDPIIAGLGDIVDYGDTANLTSFNLEDLLPTNKGFYRYSGSITTPHCDESVIWSVFKEPISISSGQLATFRDLEDEDGDPIVNNIRPVQPLNDREVLEHTP